MDDVRERAVRDSGDVVGGPPPEPTPSGRSRRRLVALIAGLVVLVAGGGAAVWSLSPAAEPLSSADRSTAVATAGASLPGSSSYAVPADAVIVSPAGRDGAAGTASDPVRTIWAGVRAARDGGTVVVRGGVYHETVVIPPEKRISLQASPHEEVWMDGSTTLAAWDRRGDTWTTPWTLVLDHSPTYTWGAQESTVPGWQFVSPTHPLAAHPDQLWVDATPQRQVGSREQVVAGSFFVDESAHELVLGSDPVGHTVRASSLRQAVVVQGAGSAVRGIGIRRYADSVPHQGVLTVLAPGVSVEDVLVDESATTGVGVLAPGATLRRVTVRRSGMLGVAVSRADGSVLDGIVVEDNNTEHFNHSPAAGGMKATKTRQLVVRGSRATGNDGAGLWVDESSYEVALVGNDVERNRDHGVVVEISAGAVVADNRILDNTGDGILVADSGHVRIWNNTVLGNDRSINLTQDDRDPRSTGATGRDPRSEQLALPMDWQLRSVEVHDNVVGLPNPSADALVAVEDYTKSRRAEDLDISLDGNAYVRRDGEHPEWALVWTRSGQDPAVYPSVEAFTKATGQEKYHMDLDRQTTSGAEGLLPSQRAAANTVARPLPADLAREVGQPEGSRVMGSFR